MRPLQHLLVLDFSTLLPGPLATLMLCEAGAEVIKIERPGGGDEMRGYPPGFGGASANFALLNRGKRSVTLDLKDRADRERLHPLLQSADVLVEQFRPGVMDRLGLSYAAVAAINPRLIYCSITGYGQTGPRRHASGHDLNYIAGTGLLALGHGDPARPVVPPALIADIAGGAYPAVMNILLALTARAQGGGGRHLDISMTDNLFPFLYWAMGQGLAGGVWPGNGTDLVTGGSARYRLYPTADGGLLAAAPIEDRFWAVFCAAIGLAPALRDDARDPAATVAGVAAIIAASPAAHWRAVFGQADCCCAVVATLQQAMADPHFAARGLFAHGVTGAGGARLPALPLALDPAFRAPPGDAGFPAPGADNAILPP